MARRPAAGTETSSWWGRRGSARYREAEGGTGDPGADAPAAGGAAPGRGAAPVPVPVRAPPPRSERRAPRAEPRAGTAAAGRGVALTDGASRQSARVRTRGAAAPSCLRCACAGAEAAGSCSLLPRSPLWQPMRFSLFFSPSFFRIFFLLRAGLTGSEHGSRPIVLAAGGAGRRGSRHGAAQGRPHPQGRSRLSQLGAALRAGPALRAE